MNKVWCVLGVTLMIHVLAAGAVMAGNLSGNPWIPPEEQAGQGAVTAFQVQFGQDSTEIPPANAQVGPGGDCLQNQYQTCTQSQVQYESMLQEQSQLMTQLRIGQEAPPGPSSGMQLFTQQRSCDMNCTAAMTSLQSHLQRFQQYQLQQMTNNQLGGMGLFGTTIP